MDVGCASQRMLPYVEVLKSAGRKDATATRAKKVIGYLIAGLEGQSYYNTFSSQWLSAYYTPLSSASRPEQQRRDIFSQIYTSMSLKLPAIYRGRQSEAARPIQGQLRTMPSQLPVASGKFCIPLRLSPFVVQSSISATAPIPFTSIWTCLY